MILIHTNVEMAEHVKMIIRVATRAHVKMDIRDKIVKHVIEI